MRRDSFFLSMSLLGIWSSLLAIVAVWEFKGLEKGVKAFQETEKLKFVFETGPLPYVIAMISWTILLLLLGYVWSKIFFPEKNWVEKTIFSLCWGTVIMPISFLMPFFFAVTGKVIANLLGGASPAYADAILKARGFLLVNNLEQVYEFVNVLIFLMIGLVILAIKTLKPNRQTPTARNSAD